MTTLTTVASEENIATSTDVSNQASGGRSVVMVIPLRDRDGHAHKFLENMASFAAETEAATGVETDYHVVFAEVLDDPLFNKGVHFNIGFEYVSSFNWLNPKTCVAVQDVDSLPQLGVDFADCDPPTHMAREVQEYGWKHMNDHFCGISFSMTVAKWREVNGMSNKYTGWAMADNVSSPKP